jgi:hypothetical protein
MITEAQLTIRLTPGTALPEWRRGSVNDIRGGPEMRLDACLNRVGFRRGLGDVHRPVDESRCRT